jgi:hypothetical protein
MRDFVVIQRSHSSAEAQARTISTPSVGQSTTTYQPPSRDLFVKNVGSKAFRSLIQEQRGARPNSSVNISEERGQR